ncbi:hypothetical protein M758_4G140500 [Ceratodon purpureus]|nr:hypothetical protein M758_4G140500 [Ceratodon purpureus]
MAARQQKHRRSKSAGGKSKGGGNFARSTRASRLKQVSRDSVSLVGQEVFLDQGAKCERLIMLKNLAKVLVDRIEAACAAKNTSQVSNPNKVLNTATDSRLSRGTIPGSEVSDPSQFIRRDENHEVGNSCQSHEYGSNVDVDESCAESAYLSTQKRSGHLGDYRSSPNIRKRNRRVRKDDSRGGHRDLELESHSCSRGTSLVTQSSSMCDTYEAFRPDSRPSSQTNPGSSTYTISENFGDPDSVCLDSRPSSRPNQSGNSSRPPTREWISSPVPGSRGKTENAASISSRMLPLKKVNVGLDDCEMPPKMGGVHPTPRRKIRSPGLRSLVVPQVKSTNTTPGRLPANTKLVLDSSTSKQKHTEVSSKEEPTQNGVGNFESEELYKEVWADVVQNVFDEVFRGEEEPSHDADRKQSLSPKAQLSTVPRPLHSSAEWIIQMQSIRYRSWGPERSLSPRKSVHKATNVDNQYLKTPREESTSREPGTSTQRSTRSKESVRGKAPVILPTLAKYHLDKIERYKKCVAEKQLKERGLQQECRPSTAPDPYNVLNVYAERCALRRSTPQKSEHILDWQADERKEVDNHPVTDQPNSILRERVPTKSSPTKRNLQECRKSMSAGSIPGQKSLQYRPLKSSHIPEVDRPNEKSINLRQETRRSINLNHEPPRSKFEEKLLETKNRIISQKQFVNRASGDQHLLRSRKNLQAQQAIASTEVVSKKARFRDHWPFLDRQIESFIQAHILQCCILFKNVPLVFPTLEYQEEIQRLYSDRPLST